MDRVIFYNNEGIKLCHILVHLLMQRGMNWNVSFKKQLDFSTAIVIARGLLL